MNRRGQSWSMDIVLAVVIFGFIAVTLTSFALLDRPDIQTLQQDAQQISSELGQSFSQCDGRQVFRGNALDANATECLFEQNYTDLKQQFRTQENFCIYLEDQNGRIIQVAGKNSIGSDEVNVSGVPCGQ